MFLNNIDGNTPNKRMFYIFFEVFTKCIYTMTLHLQSGQLLDIKVDMVVTCQADLTQGSHMASSIGASIMSPIISSSFLPTPGTFISWTGTLNPNGPFLSFSIC